MVNHFSASVLSVHQNAIKNIVFRLSTILLQLTVYKLFSYLAFNSNAYTSYLMFVETVVQKFWFIFSRGLTRQALIVLAFTALFTAAGFYDTLLWALDSPGFVTRSSTVDATSVAHELLKNPAYITFVSDLPGNVGSINVDEAIGANLFKSGFNFTFPGLFSAGVKDIVPSNQSMDIAGPRIWLDDGGFSVGVDQALLISGTSICPTPTLDANTLIWRCKVNNTDALSLVLLAAGRPLIWWDDVQSEYLSPNRRDNPWDSLGTGGDTAAMKQVFTVTKDRRRHTFLETVVKVSMVTLFPTPFNDTEITEMVRRMFSTNTSEPITPKIQSLADIVISAQANQTSLTTGTFIQQNYSVASASIELLNALSPAAGDRVYTLLRMTSTNITLIRSETLPNPVTPFAPCSLFFSNLATGGKVRSSNCYKSLGNQTNARFLGQLDTSSMIILSDVLGDGSTSTSAAALNQTGLDWFNHNNDRIEQLLISRGLILGGDRATVLVEVKHDEAAVSYLQLLLAVLPALFALVAWILVMRGATGYYSSSFLTAVCATTHVTADSTCRKVGYLHAPPEMTLKNLGEHVVIGTPSGVLMNAPEVEQAAVAYTTTGGVPLFKQEALSQSSMDQMTPTEERSERGVV